MLDLLAIALMQGLTFGVGALGLVVAFRVVRYPDLTADGSFILGAAVFAAVVIAGGGWVVACLFALAAGGAAGVLTSVMNSALGVNRLLTGIITTMMAYSVSFRILGRPNIGLIDEATMFPNQFGAASLVAGSGSAESWRLAIAGAFALAFALLTFVLLRSQLGLLLRATGANARLVEDIGRRPAIYRAVGLLIANALVATAGALVAAQQGFADVNMGTGTIITLLASLVIGEEIMLRLTRRDRLGLIARIVAAFSGATLYFLLYLVILRASLRDMIPFTIEPTDLKFLSALVLIVVIALRMRSSKGEEVLPI